MREEDEIMVSICCMAYNHEKYITDAIEGFLMQKTDFRFEILIHDDASTDRTADIIRIYAQKYPEIIKPIYQTINQQSKGVRINLTFNYPRARGKYIALCEGDDYWIDPFKLQKQIIEMEKYPECHISFHPAIMKRADGKVRDKKMCVHSNKNKIYSTEEVILGESAFMPVNSIVIRKTATHRILSFLTTTNVSAGDYYIQILCSENGGALYISDLMSVYRKGVSNSWTARMNKSARNNNSFLNSFINANNRMNEFTNYKYSKQFEVINKKTISRKLRSISIDFTTRKEIIDLYSKEINFIDKFLCYTFFGQPQITNAISKICREYIK